MIRDGQYLPEFSGGTAMQGGWLTKTWDDSSPTGFTDFRPPRPHGKLDGNAWT